MEPLVVKPEKELKALWQVYWAIWFIVLVVPGLILALAIQFPENIIFWSYAALCSIIMLLILLWITPFYRSLEYVIDADAVRGEKGVFWRRRTSVPYAKITNIDISQGPVERAFGIGKVHVQTAGAGGQQGARAELKVVGVRDLDGTKDAIMARVREWAPSAAAGAGAEGGEEGSRELLARMLEELAAIRQVLEADRT